VQHINTSGFQTLLYPTISREGRETAVAVVRATFELNDRERLVPSPEQVPVRLEDVYFGAPGVSSSLEESDLAVYKPGTDVVVVGEAHAPKGRAATQVQVGVRVGDLHKSALVVGDRSYRSAFGVGPLAPSAPVPFTTLPLVWERAFGGRDANDSDTEQSKFEARNQVGCGFGTVVPDGRLPNIYPLHGGGVDSDRPQPWALSPVGRAWLPRHLLAGTYDAHWQTERAPFLPLDFDYRFFQCGSEGLVSRQHLRGDEPVRIVNMSEEGELAFTLPGLVMGMSIRIDRRPLWRCLAALDTVILRPSRRQVALVWRRAIACRRSVQEVFQVVSFAVSPDGARSVIGAEADAPIGEPTWNW
jgi:hypothetical protein